MEMKTVILISFALGVIATWDYDKAIQNYYGKDSLLDKTIPPLSIIFVIYAFFQSINFGFMAILQILLGAYIGKNVFSFIKRVVKKLF